MPPLTPQITLTANLESIVGGAAEGGYLRVTLCGYGPQLPAVPGTCMLADAGVPQYVGPQQGSTALSVVLFGNDVITPANTFYEVAVLDASKDVIQTGMYQFTGSGTTDLSNAAQILPPFNLGFLISMLNYKPCALVVGSGGSVFTAPGQPVIAVAYNGILLNPGTYTVSGTQITLVGWSIELGDSINAFCIFH